MFNSWVASEGLRLQWVLRGHMAVSGFSGLRSRSEPIGSTYSSAQPKSVQASGIRLVARPHSTIVLEQPII